MHIAMDAIVHQYLLLSLNSVREIAADAIDERVRERLVMGALESMLSLETIAHEFDSTENIDVFTSTPRLIQNWPKIFPRNVLKAGANDEYVVYEMSGDRSDFFNKRWLSKRLKKEGVREWNLIVGLDS
jgi:hypothetical protein